MDRFAKQEQIPIVQFQKGQRKDDVMKEHLARFGKPEGVLFIGKAQEKTSYSAPRSVATPRPAIPIHGLYGPPPW